jgi:hypothetical protein
MRMSASVGEERSAAQSSAVYLNRAGSLCTPMRLRATTLAARCRTWRIVFCEAHEYRAILRMFWNVGPVREDEDVDVNA